MLDYAIRTEHLTRTFGSLRAVDDLTLEVPRGIIFGFLGPNGAGKTTTIRLLLGLLPPSAGTACVLGYDVITQADAIRARCGALLEHPGLYERLSAEDNLEFFARVARLPRGERQARIRQLLTDLGLWERRRETVATWSRGMKQKLAIARALLHRPDLLFLDEPTAGLDAVSAAALREDLANLARQEGITIFLTTHNLSEAEKLCQQVAVIRSGRLLAVGSPHELQKRRGEQVRLVVDGLSEAVLDGLRLSFGVEVIHASPDNGDLVLNLGAQTSVAPLVTYLVQHGVAVEEVQRERASLEEVFLSLVQENNHVA
ncbi:ABC transporter ATP-binding protein [Thermanaerothrix sp. 4228-RoL]|uniref:ABC transporter ATP-binding protein n=1 Tax=Thermanaerothrix solaris TaxID=3058434 RepID=A0ABU3NPG2_9CHLR|nr:ABC transporter ATP-binding protein [Thermanaerothrix sp. 4228-RoL]MDT8898255.1 ABC transporter ATP-binding protein [Thermanaerothrix sp. 4228-RoL]